MSILYTYYKQEKPRKTIRKIYKKTDKKSNKNTYLTEKMIEKSKCKIQLKSCKNDIK